MAFADTSLRKIVEAACPCKITLAAACSVGDLLGYSSGWKLADGDTGPIAPLLVAGEDGASGDEITAYRHCVVDGFTGGTAGNELSASATAGKYAESGTYVVGLMLTATAAVIDMFRVHTHT